MQNTPWQFPVKEDRCGNLNWGKPTYEIRRQMESILGRADRKYSGTVGTHTGYSCLKGGDQGFRYFQVNFV